MKHVLNDEIETSHYPRAQQPSSVETSKLYRAEIEVRRKMAARQGLWIAVIVYLIFSITDLILVPDVARQTIAARFTVGALVLLVMEIQVRLQVKAKWLDLTCAAALVSGYIGWLSFALTTNAIQSMTYYMVFGTIFMMGANLFFSFRFRLSLATSGTVLAIFFVALLTMFPRDNAYLIAFGTFYLACFVFTSYVNWRLNRERYNVFLNALEAKIQHNEASERGKALLRLSNTDYLTGLENRRAIDQRLRDHWNEWLTAGTDFAAILVDVDFFKKYNDFYGHQEGDRCLALVANALKVSLEKYDASLGRYGGEEFIVLAKVSTREQVAILSESIRRTVEDLALMHDQRRDGSSIVTVSVGAAFTRKQIGPKLEKIINEADRALYGAKANGRNCVRLFDPNDPQTNDESENIAALLRVAIGHGLVSMVYQPIQNVKTGRVEAVEALMRLQMLDGAPVPPSLFIPIAERTGTILELGIWSIRKVCQELLVHGHAPVVSVNVSPIQLKTPGFAASVAAILGETGLAGSRLAFEITEGIEMERQSDILRCINDLETLGIRIWLDDFGTGFAGLSWLRLINFDTVKIDRSFLHDCHEPKGRAMLQDIIGLVRNRGHKILVEGVETEEQLDLMREFRIDQVQGYHVGRPVSANNLKLDATVYKLENRRRRPV